MLGSTNKKCNVEELLSGERRGERCQQCRFHHSQLLRKRWNIIANFQPFKFFRNDKICIVRIFSTYILLGNTILSAYHKDSHKLYYNLFFVLRLLADYLPMESETIVIIVESTDCSRFHTHVTVHII